MIQSDYASVKDNCLYPVLDDTGLEGQERAGLGETLYSELQPESKNERGTQHDCDPSERQHIN